MGLRLLIGPVGSGKTGRALETLQALKAAEPLAQVWALMATERQIIAFRNRLLTPGRGVLNLNFFNFHLLYEQITQSAGWPQRVLHSAHRAALLREVLRDRWQQPGAIFRPLPGFVEVIGAFIDEMKQWQISPAQFAASAGDDAKLTELAAIYTDYQARLEELRLLDREGLGMFALECLRGNSALAADVDLLLVDGFDQFNPLHAALIAALSQRAASATVSLTAPDGPGSETAGFSRFTLARGRLLRAYRAAQGLPETGLDDGDLVIERMPAPVEPEPARCAVRHLVGQIWAPLPERAAACAYAPPALCAPGVSFLEAPDLAAETAAVLRRVKALLLGDAGVGAACRPDDILIAVRDWGRYGPHLNALGRRYGLPLSLHEGAPLAENPAIAALLRLLALPESDYRRQNVLDAVASPYVSIPDLPEDGVTLLEQAARAAFVLSGRGEWQDALANGLKPMTEEDEDAAENAPVSAPAARFRSVEAALERLFDAVELAPVARVKDFTDRIDALIGADEAEALPLEASDAPESHSYTLGLLAAVRADRDPERMARDLKALHALKGVLRDLRASAVLLAGMGITTTDQVTRAEFLAGLRRAIAQVTAEDAQGRDGRVLATTVADARGLPHPHVFILGLSESVFPAPVPEDPLLLESERRALQDKGLPLPLRAERSDDAGLFYELAGLAGSTLTLSRPALRDGAEWIESALWRTAAASFDEPLRTTLKVGAVTPSGECATQEEAALAIAASAGNNLPPLEGGLAGWLASADGLAWARLGRAHAIEASRLSRQSHYDTYAGRLADGELIAQLAERFGPGYAWSASQLNTLGECGFRFFSQRLLGLNTLEPPKVGLDVLQRGTLYHMLLERTYTRIRDEALALTSDNLDRALALLELEADRTFAHAPAELGFRPRPGWAQEQRLMRQQVADLVRADFAGEVAANQQKTAPGDGSDARRVIFLETAYDTAGLLTLGNGQPVRVRGRFDRIDRQGERWLVVDYKSGQKPIGAAETTRGRNFQMMIYLLALRAQQPEGAVGGFFWHITNQEASGALWLDTDAGDSVVAQGTSHIVRRIAEAQAGDFSIEPNGMDEGRCSRYCDYQALCRMAVTPRRKSRAEAAP